MRDYGRIYSSFWTSPDVQALSDDGKLLALYLLSGPHGTLAGVCRLPDGYICEDLHWTSQRVAKGFAELFRKGFANRCETTNWVFIRKFLAWNRPENPNQWKAARKIANQVPAQCAWKPEFIGFFDSVEAGEPLPTSNPSETVPKPLPTQEQEQEQEQEKETVPASKRATRRCPVTFAPDLAWAVQQIPDLNAEAEAGRFRDYEFKTARSDWSAAWRNWIRTCKDSGKYAKSKSAAPIWGAG